MSKLCKFSILWEVMGSNDTNGINTFPTGESKNHDIRDLTLQRMNK